MKNKKISGKWASILLAITSATLGATSAAQAQEVDVLGAFKVPDTRHTNADHSGAEIMVFKTNFADGAKPGLFFMQLMGEFQNGAFFCNDAEKDSATKSISCSTVANLCDGVENSVKETLTVGLLNGDFCQDLRDEHNMGFDTPIYEEGDCTDDKCICYDLQYTCWNGTQYGAACTGDFAARIRSNGNVPPGNGAGSGGSH